MNWINYFSLISVSVLILLGFIVFKRDKSYVAYSIIKHRFMDIRMLVLKSVAYSLTLAAIAGAYIAITVFVFRWLIPFVSHTVIDVITLLVLLFTFSPLRRFIENRTDKLFFKGHYSFNELLRKLNDITKKNSRSIETLATKLIQTLNQEMRINKSAFILISTPDAKIYNIGFESKLEFFNNLVNSATISEDIIFFDELDENSETKEILRKIDSEVIIPIKMEKKIEAFLVLGEKKSGDMYTYEDLRLLELIAPQIGLALENAKSFQEKEQRIKELGALNTLNANLYENLERSFMETISALAAAVDAKDHYTYGHSEAVTQYSTAIAKEIGLPSEEIKVIKIASKLHDVGKIGINENILTKAGKLSKKERNLIELHPKIGVNILKNVESVKDALPLILHHHERIDGNGYPAGLSGNSIPIGARIITVADSFHAMNSNRPYRKALPLRFCIDELKKGSGTQFDEDIVKVIIKLINQGKFINIINDTKDEQVAFL